MQTIPLTELVIEPNRQRKTFDIEPIDQLRASIIEHGLFHPIVLQNDGKTLVAGERRLRAIKSIYGSNLTFFYDGEQVPAGSTPFIRLADLSRHAIKEAELHENTVRINLSWQEEQWAISELHRLKQEQNAGQTPKQTAAEFFPDISPNYGNKIVRDATIIAKHLDDPTVRNAGSAKNAMRVIQRKVSEAAKNEAAKSITGMDHTLLIGDAAELLPTFPDGSFDLILSDPPYGMNAKEFAYNSRGHEYDEDDLNAYLLLAEHAGRLTTARGLMVLFLHINFFNEIAEMFRDEGWAVFSTPLIWFKTPSQTGFQPWGTRGPRRRYEALMFAAKTAQIEILRSFSDVIEHPPVADAIHPAEKPVGLYKYLMNNLCFAGARVIDPFCGTGPLFPAATQLGMKATGIEKNPTFAQLAKEKLETEDTAKGLEERDVARHKHP